MECAFVGVVEEANKVCLHSFLEGKEGHALHSQIRLYATSNLKNRLPGDGDSFTAMLAILIARARSVGNVAYLFV
jgi:hypothetical protein